MRRTGQIGAFVITSEGSIASGVRRIEARTGGAAVEHMQAQRATLQRVSVLVGGSVAELDQRTEELVQHARQLEKRVKALEAEQSVQQAAVLAAQAKEIHGVRLIVGTFEDESPAALKALAERLRNAEPRTVAYLVTTRGGRLGIACAVSDDLAAGSPPISAADLVKEAAAKAGGGGGGRATFATAGAKGTTNLDTVLKWVRAEPNPRGDGMDWEGFAEFFKRVKLINDPVLEPERTEPSPRADGMDWRGFSDEMELRPESQIS